MDKPWRATLASTCTPSPAPQATTSSNFGHVCIRKMYVLCSRGGGQVADPDGCLLEVRRGEEWGRVPGTWQQMPSRGSSLTWEAAACVPCLASS